MTQSLPSKHGKTVNKNLTDITQKSFFDLSAAEIEQLAVKATTKARKRMHDKGISTIISIDENIYEEHPDGSLTLLHERLTK
jgi:hypothetical protein